MKGKVESGVKHSLLEGRAFEDVGDLNRNRDTGPLQSEWHTSISHMLNKHVFPLAKYARSVHL